MDERDEPGLGEQEPVDEPTTDKVRIVGAQPAAAAAAAAGEGTQPAAFDQDDGALSVWDRTLRGDEAASESTLFEYSSQDRPEEDSSLDDDLEMTFAERSFETTESARRDEPSDPSLILPHWTEPPTGQVPAIVDRRGNDSDIDPLAVDGGPSWRAHDHEWEDDDFEPSFLADDETRQGALEDKPLEERRPWEFDDLTPSGRVGISDSRDASGDVQDATSEEEPWEPARTSGWVSIIEEEIDAHDEWTDDAGRRWEEQVEVARWSTADPGEDTTQQLPVRRDEDETELEPANARAGTMLSIGSSTIERPAPFPDPADEEEEDPVVQDRATRRSGEGRRGRGLSGVRSRVGLPHRKTGARRPPARPAAAPAGEPAGSGDRAERPGGSGRRMPVAVATGVAIALLALLCFDVGTVATLVLATIIATLAAAECYAALRRSGRRPATLLGLIATIGLMVSVYAKGTPALALIVAIMVIASMVWYLTGAGEGSAIEGMTSTVFAFVWVGVLASFAALMLAPSQFPHRHGIAFLLGAIVATVGADVGALLIGRWAGRHPLAPEVSPHKTWEGVIGGGVVAVVASVVVTAHVHPWTVGTALCLGLVVAAVAPIGDLCESLIKRELGFKDMGAILPGHGGVLDRVDALLFVLPATYYLVRVLQLG